MQKLQDMQLIWLSYSSFYSQIILILADYTVTKIGIIKLDRDQEFENILNSLYK